MKHTDKRNTTTNSPARHNYLEKVARLTDKLAPGTVTEVSVLHDDWCNVFRGGYCNCNPDVRVIPQRRFSND